jgi:hypothetical protein
VNVITCLLSYYNEDGIDSLSKNMNAVILSFPISQVPMRVSDLLVSPMLTP